MAEERRGRRKEGEGISESILIERLKGGKTKKGESVKSKRKPLELRAMCKDILFHPSSNKKKKEKEK